VVLQSPLLPVVLICAFIGFLFWTWRQNELFHVSVRSGRVLLIRGRIPSALLSDFRTVVRHVNRASIRVQKTAAGGRLATAGIDADTTQKLRNLFGLYTQAQLRSAPPIRNPTLGQWLGSAGLAWWQERRK
jgi:Protein of unknown function (DUF3634)